MPLKELGWSIGDVRRTIDLIVFQYQLKIGPPGHRGIPLKLDEHHKQSLKNVLDWTITQFEPLLPYEILGQTITPIYEIDNIYRAIIGQIFGTPEGSYKVSLVIRHPKEYERGPEKIIYDKELPGEKRELLASIDELLWRCIREDIIIRFNIPKDMLPIHLNKHVFLAYKSDNESSEKTARKLGKFLIEKGVGVWLFPWRVGWADSITEREEQAIIDSFGAVMCFTPDFLEGATAKEEYRALLAKRRREPDFKFGYLLIGCNHKKAPPFMADYFGGKIDDHKDQRFEEEANKIYRGLLGLPLESPEDV